MQGDQMNTPNNMNQNQSDTEHEFDDTAVGSLEHNQQLPVLTPRSSNIGYLERCGRWLMAIPRDDVVALQQTSEYREFLSAFDKLGEVCIKHYYIAFYCVILYCIVYISCT